MSVKKTVHDIRRKLPLKLVQKIFFGILLFIGFGLGVFISQIIITFSELEDIKPLENYSRFSVPTKVYDVNNNLITEFYLEKRELISYKDLPDNLIKGIIAIEDNAFYQHKGVNYFAILRALLINIFFREVKQGGSTITQQLAKGLFTTGEKSIFRKIIELWYAFQIEKKYSKEEILELYFNQVYFGHGCYGVQAASHYFFDKDIKDVSLAEASLLCGLVNAPSAYSPIFQPYKAQNRHRLVLNSMAAIGFISKNTADEAFEGFWENYSSVLKAKEISAQRSEKNYAPYFTEYVRTLLIDKYGEEKIYSSGMQIFTTLDLNKQKIAQEQMIAGVSNEQVYYDRDTRYSSQVYKERYEDIIDLLSLTLGMDSIGIGYSKLKDRLNRLAKNYEDVIYLSSFAFGMDGVNKKIKTRFQLSRLLEKKQDQVECALISINPKNGYIEAMVGGSSFNYANQYNRAIMAQRQMGSLFKPVFYSMAIEKGLINPATTNYDKPEIYIDVAGTEWQPRNYDGEFRGLMRVRQALQLSINIIAIKIWDQLLKTIGFNNLVPIFADMFGISLDEAKKRIQPSLSFALGVGTFSPYEVARSFAVIANDGVAVKPLAILRIKDRYGRVIEDFEMQRDLDKNSRKQVMTKGAAYIMQSMMNSVLFNGTGAEAARGAGFNLNAGGKTGTTPNWKDAWFAGFTKNLVTVVWYGFDDSRKSMGRGRAAAVVAAPVWMRYMLGASKGLPNTPFSPPGDEVFMASVCAETGLTANPYCPETVGEYFLRNAGPAKTCDLHSAENQGKTLHDDLHNNATNNIRIDDLNLDLNKDKNDGLNPGLDDSGGMDLGNLKLDQGL